MDDQLTYASVLALAYPRTKYTRRSKEEIAKSLGVRLVNGRYEVWHKAGHANYVATEALARRLLKFK